MNSWNLIASQERINKTIEALKKNGFDAEFVKTGEEAKVKVLSMIPKGAEVMAMSSVTLQKVGLMDSIDKSGDYNSVRNELMKMDRKTDSLKMQKLGASPEWAVGSVHAVTEDGKLLIASNTGSQLPSYVYASAHVIFVVGTQKIVKDEEEGKRRIYEYILPLESERINKSYNTNMGSFVSKLLIINREIIPQRLHLIFVNEALGF